MRVAVLLLLCVTGCNGVGVSSDAPGTDYNDDGRIGFSDLERGRPAEPGIDVDRVHGEHLEKQDPEYKRRIRDD